MFRQLIASENTTAAESAVRVAGTCRWGSSRIQPKTSVKEELMI
jgi:hypothetical protein